MAALAPLARPTGPEDQRDAAQRRADAMGELARQALQAGHLPDSGGLRPQVTVTMELAGLLASCGGVGGVGGWGGILPGEAVRRLACDAAVTRAVVRRHPAEADAIPASLDGSDRPGPTGSGHGDGGIGDGGLAAALRAAAALLPPPLGAAVELLDWAAPPASSRPRCAAPSRCATAAAPHPAATARHPGPTPTTNSTGSTAGRPAWTTWSCCAAPTTAPSTKKAGTSIATRPAGR